MKRIKLTVYYKEAKPNDTLLMNVTHRYFTTGDKKGYHSTINSNGAFVFDVPVEYATGYWELRKLEYNAVTKRNLPPLIRNYFWEEGDDIVLYVSATPTVIQIKSSCKFFGNGSAKYNLLFKADSLYTNSIPFVKANPDPTMELTPMINRNLIERVSIYIDNDTNSMSDISRYLIKADLFMRQGLEISNIMRSLTKRKQIELGSKKRDSLLEHLDLIFSDKSTFDIDSNMIYFSGTAIEFLWFGIKSESILRFNKADALWMYNKIKEKYSGNLRDQTISYWLQYQRIEGEVAELIYKDAINYVKSKDALIQLKSVEHFYLKKHLKDYSLPDAKGQLVNFSQFKNKILFIDFWFTGCASCALLFNDVVSNVESQYAKDNNVVFITVSTDRLKEKWLQGLKSGLYSSDIAINLFTGGMGSLHPIISDNKISYQPVAMIVDKKGVIRYFNTDNLYTVEGLTKAIEELKKE